MRPRLPCGLLSQATRCVSLNMRTWISWHFTFGQNKLTATCIHWLCKFMTALHQSRYLLHLICDSGNVFCYSQLLLCLLFSRVEESLYLSLTFLLHRIMLLLLYAELQLVASAKLVIFFYYYSDSQLTYERNVFCCAEFQSNRCDTESHGILQMQANWR